jgi:chromate transport protein ChrA
VTRGSFGLTFIRYILPGIILVIGIVISATAGNSGVTAGALFISAATAVLLFNFLWRMGVEGNKDRDREEAARDYFDEHGRWPDDPV